MANNTLDDFESNFENLKSTVRKSFARVYATLKARELKTLRQLDAIRKQCQDNKDLKENCVQNIEIHFENESNILEHVSNYGAIKLEKLNFDSSIFTSEDYISPNDDHKYSYKTIEVAKIANEDLEAIEEAALKEITRTGHCVCYVNIRTEDVSRKFRELVSLPSETSSETIQVCVENEVESENMTEDEKSDCSSNSDDLKKINPTDDWLNSIKNQTETEPSQVNDVMEHSTITCP